MDALSRLAQGVANLVTVVCLGYTVFRAASRIFARVCVWHIDRVLDLVEDRRPDERDAKVFYGLAFKVFGWTRLSLTENLED